MTDMAEAMMRSGFPQQYRREVLEDSIVGYQRQVTASEKGETPLYRGREWNKQERTKKKKMKKASWFRPYDVVLFVPTTPQGELAGRVRTVVKEEGGRLNFRAKVVERGGTTMRQHLVRTDMARSVPCTMEDCPLCITNPGEGGGAKHQKSGALYCGTCLLCAEEHEDEEHEEHEEGEHGEHGERRREKGLKSSYWGESGFNGYNRIISHISCIEKEDTDNAFAKHLAEHHSNNIGDTKAFRFKVVRTFKSPLLKRSGKRSRYMATKQTL